MIYSNNTIIKGMFLLIERENFKGLNHWTEELGKRGIPAVIQVGGSTLDNNSKELRKLSEKGLEIGGAYNAEPLWNKPFEFQFEKMNHIKKKVDLSTGRSMRVFSSKYFAYDEVTLRVAEKLGIEYILGRGTEGPKAVVYKPLEYGIKILSVSSVPSKLMGAGSLCDESLWCRGESPEGFREVLFALKEEKIILVAQTHLSGVKLRWWNVYQDFLDSKIVNWRSLDEFSSDFIVLPNSQIPINTEVKYTIPQPLVPLEEEPDFPFQ